VKLTIVPPEAAGLPAPSANAPHVEVDAPFVFRASDAGPASAPATGRPGNAMRDASAVMTALPSRVSMAIRPCSLGMTIGEEPADEAGDTGALSGGR
jgi:hypothetical protein